MSNSHATITSISQTSRTECGRRDPQHGSAAKLSAHVGRHDEDQGRRVVVAGHDRRQRRASGRGEQGEARDRGRYGRDVGDHRDARGPRRSRAVAVLQETVADHQQRKAAVPEHVEPRGALRRRAEQAGRREQARKRQRMHHRHQRAEEIRAGEQQQGARTQQAELRVEQHRGDQVAGGERRLIGRDEGPDDGKLHCRERDEDGENDNRDRADPERQRPVDRARRRVRQERQPVIQSAVGHGDCRRRRCAAAERGSEARFTRCKILPRRAQAVHAKRPRRASRALSLRQVSG